MGVSFRKPEDTYRVDLKARLDELEKTIDGFNRKGNATNTTDLNTALEELGTRVNRNVISNTYSIQRLEKTLNDFRIRMQKRETMTNGTYLELQKQLEEFENDILKFIEELNLDPDLREKFNIIEAKTMKSLGKIKAKTKETTKELSFKF